MAILKMTMNELQMVKKYPVYYNINIYAIKDRYEVECDGPTSKIIKKILNGEDPV